MNRTLSTLALIAAVCGCGQPPQPEPAQATDPGRLVIIGGALQPDNAAVYSSVLAGRDGSQPLCVISTASSDPAAAIEGMVANLTEYGGSGAAKGILLSTESPERARDPGVATEISACSGFYFTGGSQSRVLDVFMPDGDTTAAYRALIDRWREGAVVAGSSAGAAMMSRAMIAGGSSDEAIAHGVTGDSEADGVWVRPGMGFFEPILDQHFLARGRIGRLVVATMHPDTPPVGFGIDENTAMVVDGDSATVVGASGVVIVDGRAVERSGPHRGSGVGVSLAGAGDVFDLTSFEVRRASGKIELPTTGAQPAQLDDVFERWAFFGLIQALSSTTADEARFDLSGAEFRIAEDEGFSATAADYTGGVEGSPAGLSAGPFRVDLIEVPADGTR